MKMSFPTWSMSRAGVSPSTNRNARIVAFVINGSLSNPLDLFLSDGAVADVEAKDDDRCSACS